MRAGRGLSVPSQPDILGLDEVSTEGNVTACQYARVDAPGSYAVKQRSAPSRVHYLPAKPNTVLPLPSATLLTPQAHHGAPEPHEALAKLEIRSPEEGRYDQWRRLLVITRGRKLPVIDPIDGKLTSRFAAPT
ncbi:hypothetical protein NMY22_g2174 [Coprinellus aureogranulatus]|nr:hypothetical protein NMY22_g2174 [Coprinellus aureogranulatus]